MHPHRSSALDGAAAALTVARTRGVAVPLSWSWSHHPQGRAWAAAPSDGDTFDRTPYLCGLCCHSGSSTSFYTYTVCTYVYENKDLSIRNMGSARLSSSMPLSGGALLKPLSEGGGPASMWDGQSRRRRQGAFRCASVSPNAGF